MANFLRKIFGLASGVSGKELFVDQGAIGPAGETVHAPGVAVLSVPTVTITGAVTMATAPALVAGTAYVGQIGSTPFSSTSTLTRPADTTAYAIGDTIMNVTPVIITAAGVARIAGGGAWINNIRLVSSNPAAATGSFRLHMFNATLTPQADNAAFAPSDAERLTEVLSIDLDMAETGTNNVCYKPSAPWPKYVKCSAAVQALYWLLEARNAYVPANAETFDLLLQGQQD